MKPIKKEDMPKLILLIVLTVGMFGFALSQFLSNPLASVASTPPAPGAAPEGAGAGAGTPVAGAPGAPATVASPEAGVVTEPELDFMHIGPPMGGKDPFAQNGVIASATVTPAPIAAPPVVRPLPSVVANSGKRSNLETLLGVTARQNMPGMPDMEGETPGAKPATPVVVELPPPSLSVAGIVLAERDSDGIKRGRDVAILRDGSGNRRFVTVGDPIDSDYHVSAVRPGAVEIKNKYRTSVIRLDSSPVASSAPAGAATGGMPANIREISGINGATTRAN